MLPSFISDRKGQASGGAILSGAAVLILGLYVIFNMINATVAQDYVNQSLTTTLSNNYHEDEIIPNVDNNSYQTFLVSDPAIYSIVSLKNASGATIANQATAPGWQLVNATTGNISINTSGLTASWNDSQNITINYSDADIQSFTVTNTPIASTGITVRNQSGDTVTEQTAAPGWQLSSASTGTITINTSGVGTTWTDSQTVYIDYTQNRIGGTGQTTANTIVSYFWTGIVLVGVGLVALGGIYAMRVVREMRK